MRFETPIRWLLLALVLLGPALALLVRATFLPGSGGLVRLPLMAHVALTLCQACLLGFWAAFSGAYALERTVALVTLGLYLDALFDVGLPTPSYYYMPTVASLATAMSLVVVRRRAARLERFPDPPRGAVNEGLRFSIRGLMALTVVVALGITAFRSVRGLIGGPSQAGMPVIWGLAFACQSLAATWAALGPVRPLLRGVAVVVVSGVVGALLVVATDSPDRGDYVHVTATHVLESSFYLGSLLVVRSCGYRLVRLSAPSGGGDGLE